MAAIDFPNSPTVNQTVTRGGYLWIYTGVAWKKIVTATPVSTGFKYDPLLVSGA
jgi:hypothetical protein